MKKIIKNLTIATTLMLTFTACGVRDNEESKIIENTKSAKQSESFDTSYIRNIVFPEMDGEISSKLSVEKSDSLDLSQFSFENKGYVIDADAPEKLVEKIKEVLGMTDAQVVTANNKEVPENGSSLCVDENGDIIYSSGKYKMDDEDDFKEVTLSESEIKSIADNFLENIGAMDDSIVPASDGVDIEDNIENLTDKTSVTFSKGVSYYKKQGDSLIESYVFANVYVDGDGEVLSASIKNMTASDEFNIPDDYKVDINDALEKAKKLEGKVDLPEDAQNIKIDDVSMVYWTDYAYNYDDYDTSVLIPVYRFEGTCDGNSNKKAYFYEAAVWNDEE